MEMMPVVLVVIGAPIGLAIWLMVRSVQAGNRIEDLSRRIGGLEAEIFQLKNNPPSAPPSEPPPQPTPEFILPTREQIVQEQRGDLPVEPPELPAFEPAATPIFTSASTGAAPPPPVLPSTEPAGPPPGSTAPAVNWEQFLGVKGFAYAAGLAFFLGVAFAIKSLLSGLVFADGDLAIVKTG